MAAHYHQDIVSIDLDCGNIHRSFLHRSIGTGDSNANRFGVRVFRGKDAVDLSGVSCQGYFRNSNGENIALTSYGTVEGNKAFVTLPQACYNYEGNFTLAIKLVGGGITGTMRIIDGMVDNTNTGSAVAPTGSVPTYQEILALYAEMEEATEAAEAVVTKSVRYDTSQSLTDAQKAQARTNIGAADSAKSVSVESQSFTDAQKEQARANIDAASATEVNNQISSMTKYVDIEAGAEVSGYITTSGGYSNDTATLKIKKYPVREGDYLRLNIAFPFVSSGGVFQFQNDNRIPYGENTYIVGETYTAAFNGHMTVPAGATWLMVTTGASDTNLIKRMVRKIDDHYPLKVKGANVSEQDLYEIKKKADAVDNYYQLFAFAWQTDTHLFSSGTTENQMNLVSAGNIPGTQFILNDGDLINGGYYPAAQMKISLTEAVGNYKKAKCDFLQVAGNHDDNSMYQNGTDVIGYEDWNDMVIERLREYNIATQHDKRYFSRLYRQKRGNSEYRYMVICLDSGDVDYTVDQGTQYVFGFKEAQLKWLIDTLNFTQYNENVMIFVHCPLDGTTTSETVHNLSLITGILEAFANHSSYSGTSSETGWEASVSCDFTNKTYQHLLGVFQGHAHRDNLVKTNNVNYITLDNGFVENDDASGKKDAIDYVVVDVSNKKLKMFRLGGGSGVDREATYL